MLVLYSLKLSLFIPSLVITWVIPDQTTLYSTVVSPPSFSTFSTQRQRRMQPQPPAQNTPHHHHHHLLHCLHPPAVQSHHHRHCSLPHFHFPVFPTCPCLLHHGHHQVNRFIPISHHLHSHPPASQVPFSFTLQNPYQSSTGFSADGGCREGLEEGQVQEPESGIQQVDLNFELEHPGEEEEDYEEVFVLTDEWREFFAKSEAKRRMSKQKKNNQKR
ncbi:hypothetical protein HPP92_002778 [Vanilla planifolia]|uniref:Uncharacterized protein n=1 Tax=Vanilla planifolia TaxID=51239 RepID=A0A835VN24_VANPL|nr:hypothetical protein HPP92_002778 [Vanilla planifolia]